MAGQIDRSRELMSSDRLSVSLSNNSSDSALPDNTNTTTIAPVAESDVTDENDEIVKGLNFSREFYRRNSQQKDEQQSYNSDVTSFHSDGIPASLNYVFRDKTTDDPTSDTKSERDQTEVTDVQSVTTVPTEPPLITGNEQTSNTYVGYVRDSIFASFWGQKREQPSQLDICSTDQSLPEEVKRSGNSLDKSTSELHSQNSLQSDSVENTSKTWLSNIIETSEIKPVDEISLSSEDNSSESDKTNRESYVYPSTTVNNCQNEKLSNINTAALLTENVIKQTVITSADKTETIDGKYASETSVGPGSYQQVMGSQSKIDTFSNTKLIGRPISENTLSGQFCQGIISEAVSAIKESNQTDCSTSKSISTTTSATVIEQNKLSTNVSATNSSTSLTSSKSSHSEHVPKPAFDDDDFIRHTIFKPKNLIKPKPRPLDDDDQIRHTVCRPANTNYATNRPSAIVADGGEKEDYADYRPTITGWDGAPQITLQSGGASLKEEDEKWYDPSSDSDSEEFDPESIVADNDLQANVVTKRRTSKVSNISLPDADIIESVRPSQQRMRTRIHCLVDVANHFIILDMSLFDNI